MELGSAAIGLYNAVNIVKDVGTQTYRILIARSAVNFHLLKLHQAEREVAYWNGHVDNVRKHATTLSEDRLRTLLLNSTDLMEATQIYERRVKRWCKRLSVRIDSHAVFPSAEESSPLWILSDETIFDYEQGVRQQSESKHRIKNQGRSFCPIGRVGFAIYGEHLIKKQAREVAELRNLLSIKCIAESISINSAPVTSSVPASRRQSSFIQFIERAKERALTNAPINIYRIEVPDAQYKYEDCYILDPRMGDFVIQEYAIPRMSLVPVPRAAAQGLSAIENCIVISRSTLLAISEEDYEAEATKIARLFAEDEGHSKCFLVDRPDTDVLRCCGMVLYPGQGCDLLFKLPPGSNPFPRTLRQVLTDPRSSKPVHSLSDRIKFCIRMVTGLLVVHSLGFIHKCVHPETIVVVEPLPMAETDMFPYKLGHPYLTSLQVARTDNGKTKRLRYQDAIIHRGIYFHPRDQYPEPIPGQGRSSENEKELLGAIADRRLDEYRQRDDIYSMGVCLFEVVCFRSLLIWKDKPEVRYPDYVHDNEFVPLSDDLEAWKGLSPGERARAKVAILTEHVKDTVPKVLGKSAGKRVAGIIVSFLRAGYEDEAFGISLKGKGDAEVSLFFLSQAIRYFQEVHKEMLEKEKRRRRTQ